MRERPPKFWDRRKPHEGFKWNPFALHGEAPASIRHDPIVTPAILAGLGAIFGAGTTGIMIGGAYIGASAIGAGLLMGGLTAASMLLGSSASKQKFGSSIRKGMGINGNKPGALLPIVYHDKVGGTWAWWGLTSSKAGDVFGTGWGPAAPLKLNDILHVVIAWAEGECAIDKDIERPFFRGDGINDVSTGGAYTGATYTKHRVQIVNTNHYKVSYDGGSTWGSSTAIPAAGTWISLSDGVKFMFGSSTGYTPGDYWDFYAGDGVYVGDRMYYYYEDVVNRKWIYHFFHSGSMTQTVDTDLQAFFPNYDNPHQGTCYSYFRLKAQLGTDADVWKPNIEDFRIKLKKTDVLDTRTSTTGFTRNPAMIYNDLLTNARYGRGLPTSKRLSTDINSVANWCDPAIITNGGSSYTCIADNKSTASDEPGVGANWQQCWELAGSGGAAWALDTAYSSGFFFDGSIGDRKEANEVLKDALDNFCGYSFESERKHRLKVWDDDASVMTFSQFENEVEIDASSFRINKPGIQESPNIVKCWFINPDLNYGRDSQQYPDDDAGSALPPSGNPVILEIDLIGTQSAFQAKKIAKFYYERLKYSARFDILAHPKVFALEPGDMITVTHSFPGWVAQKLRIESIGVMQSGMVPVVLMEDSSTIYGHDAPPTPPPPPGPGPGPGPNPTPVDPEAPTGLTTLNMVTYQDYSLSAEFVQGDLQFTSPSDAYEFIIELRLQAWADESVESIVYNIPKSSVTGMPFYKHISLLTTDTPYKWRVKSVDPVSHKESVWSAYDTFTTPASSVVPMLTTFLFTEVNGWVDVIVGGNMAFNPVNYFWFWRWGTSLAHDGDVFVADPVTHLFVHDFAHLNPANTQGNTNSIWIPCVFNKSTLYVSLVMMNANGAISLVYDGSWEFDPSLYPAPAPTPEAMVDPLTLAKPIGALETVWGPESGVIDVCESAQNWISDLTTVIKAFAVTAGGTVDETTAANNATANDLTLMAASPAVDDAYYIVGRDVPFRRIEITIGTLGIGTFKGVVEYETAAGWKTRPIAGLYADDDMLGYFYKTATGIRLFDFGSIPSDWIQSRIEVTSGVFVTGYAIRIRVTSFTSQSQQCKGNQIRICAFAVSSDKRLGYYRAGNCSIRIDVPTIAGSENKYVSTVNLGTFNFGPRTNVVSDGSNLYWCNATYTDTAELKIVRWNIATHKKTIIALGLVNAHPCGIAIDAAKEYLYVLHKKHFLQAEGGTLKPQVTRVKLADFSTVNTLTCNDVDTGNYPDQRLTNAWWMNYAVDKVTVRIVGNTLLFPWPKVAAFFPDYGTVSINEIDLHTFTFKRTTPDASVFSFPAVVAFNLQIWCDSTYLYLFPTYLDTTNKIKRYLLSTMELESQSTQDATDYQWVEGDASFFYCNNFGSTIDRINYASWPSISITTGPAAPSGYIYTGVAFGLNSTHVYAQLWTDTGHPAQIDKLIIASWTSAGQKALSAAALGAIVGIVVDATKIWAVSDGNLAQAASVSSILLSDFNTESDSTLPELDLSKTDWLRVWFMTSGILDFSFCLGESSLIEQSAAVHLTKKELMKYGERVWHIGVAMSTLDRDTVRLIGIKIPASAAAVGMNTLWIDPPMAIDYTTTRVSTLDGMQDVILGAGADMNKLEDLINKVAFFDDMGVDSVANWSIQTSANPGAVTFGANDSPNGMIGALLETASVASGDRETIFRTVDPQFFTFPAYGKDRTFSKLTLRAGLRLITPTNCAGFIGFSTQPMISGAPTDYCCHFKWDTAVDANLYGRTYTSGQSLTSALMALDSNRHELKLELLATEARFYVDDILIDTITTHLPLNTKLIVYLMIRSLTTGVPRKMVIDWVYAGPEE